MLPLRRLLIISRPIGYVPALAIFGAGVAQARGGWSWNIAVLSLFFTLPFGLLAYGINDIADRESDVHNNRKGGVDGAVLQPHEVRPLSQFITALLAVFILVCILMGAFIPAVLISVLSLLSVCYSVRPIRLKSIPIADSLTNVCGILLIYLTGFWATTASFSSATLPSLHLLGGIAAFAAAFHAMGAVTDYTDDLHAGDHTIATALRPAPTLIVCALLFLACYGLVGVHHFLTGTYLIACTALTLIAASRPRPRLVRNYGLVILILFPLAILPAIV